MTSPATTRLTDPDTLAAITRAAREQCWRAGDLQWMLDEGQLDGPQRRIYEKSRDCKSKTFVTEDARRLGKTCAHVIIAYELALKNPGRRINWCQDTAKAVRDMAKPLFEKLAKDAPADCKPVWHDHRSMMLFPNGAYIFVFGGDTQADADNARGGDNPIASFIDEGGSVAWLKYIYSSIVKPGHRRTKRSGHFGMIFIASSTPENLDHYFLELAAINERKGSYVSENIYASSDAGAYIAEEADDLDLTVEQFKETDTFRREFMCERIVNAERIVFPEMHTTKENVVQEWERPLGFEQFVFKRVSADLGMSDKTGLLFGYADFTAQKAVVEDELLLTRPNTRQIAEAITAKELELWGEALEGKQRYRTSRVVDDPHGRVILDLWELHRVSAEKAIKHDRDASIGLIRTWLLGGKLVIHPRCVNLLKQLRTAKKNNSGRDFAEAQDGHFDLAAALMYFVRGLALTTNPYPVDFEKLTGRTMPDHHPLAARRALMGQTKEVRGLAGALLSGNRFVQGQLRRKP